MRETIPQLPRLAPAEYTEESKKTKRERRAERVKNPVQIGSYKFRSRKNK